MMRISKLLIVQLLVLGFYIESNAQQAHELSGKVVGTSKGNPVAGAVISVKNNDKTVQTDANGEFTIAVENLNGEIKVWAPGFFEREVPILGRDRLFIDLVPEDRLNHKDVQAMADPRFAQNQDVMVKGNFRQGALYVEDVIQGVFPGLNVINKSGMPGEGSVINLRGIRSMTGENSPLIVINGIPYLPDMNNSAVIGGYSRSVFNAINVNDVQNIRLLKGPETAMYGSLGSNGVLLIETSEATDLETKIEFSGQYGIATNPRNLPVLGVDGFKSYIGNVGLTRYADMGEMLELFPFLRDDPDYYYNFLYNNDTDWQSLLYSPSFVTDNTLRIKGGDAIAKYDLSVGVLNQGGTYQNSRMTRYSTRLNANVNLTKDLELFASMGLSYSNSSLHEQGMLQATNPLLAASGKAPILSPFRKDEFNNELPTYDVVRQFGVSNPLALLHTTNMISDAYDLFLNTGLHYQLNQNWKATGVFGYYAGYNRQSAFIPGRTSRSIVPLEDGVALNTARAGTGQVFNTYYNVNLQYNKDLGRDKLDAGIGYQGILNSQEFDAGIGRNTSSDFYRTLSYVDFAGRSFWGYIEKWNWMSIYGYANYDFNNQLVGSFYASADGASSTGAETSRYGFFPGAALTWRIKNTDWLKNVNQISSLNFRGGYSITGNSRFSSNLSRQYYTSQIYRQLAGIVRGNVANTSLQWEKNYTQELGVEAGILNNRLMVTVDAYNTLSKDVILPQPVSPVYGTDRIFVNSGQISNKGIELGIQATLIENRDYSLSIGGSINRNRNVVESLGGSGKIKAGFDDGAVLITKVGHAPYSFYGFQTNGVIASQEEAESLNLVDYKGDAFSAGDIRFVDLNQDGRIDENDRTVIGNALPDFFGGFYTHVRYKMLTLTAHFNYSIGNQAYNAVRRDLESMSGFQNQSTAVERRWQTDGQVTNMPQAMFGDPMQNSRFSDRWIEDASFLRMSNLTFNYQLQNSRFKMMEGANIYISGENLFTFSKYLGLDPVTAFSYDPMMLGFDYGNLALPRTFKVGFNVLF
ncbi:SusC/RagA family TonB-linked outer membrane protein [Belliella marina]|uniref:SusC/RagA family TonB-linked outer membrane protein n=1 Tax=Belliella marina TaxID=1644146 RepID=A0ABW4VRI1_9BACT